MNKFKKEYLIISILPISMIVLAFILESPSELFSSLLNIIKSKDVLIADYFVIGSIGGALLNSAIIGLANMYLLYHYKLKLNGLLIAAIFLMISFGFMGKNIINIIPFYIGTYIYSKVFNKKFTTLLALTMMATTLAPVVTIIFPYGIFIAIISGFIIPIVSQHTLHYHNGYSLYNTGLAGGLIGILIFSILRARNIIFEKNNIYYNEFNTTIFLFFLFYFIILIIIGLYHNRNMIKDIRLVYKHTGRLVTDFVKKEGFYTVLFNMGTIGLVSLLLIYPYKIINGPIICSILTVVAFGGFGKHLKNIIPLFIGVIIARYIFKIQITDTLFLMSLFFSTTLAPIAGRFGLIYGIIAGILHYTVSINIGVIHGGINLYNNGLAAGIVASIYIPVLEAFKGGINIGIKKETNSKNDR